MARYKDDGALCATQLASIESKLLNTVYLDPVTKNYKYWWPMDANSTLKRLVPGLQYQLAVLGPWCILYYGGYSYPLNAGWNTIIWKGIK